MVMNDPQAGAMEALNEGFLTAWEHADDVMRRMFLGVLSRHVDSFHVQTLQQLGDTFGSDCFEKHLPQEEIQTWLSTVTIVNKVQAGYAGMGVVESASATVQPGYDGGGMGGLGGEFYPNAATSYQMPNFEPSVEPNALENNWDIPMDGQGDSNNVDQSSNQEADWDLPDQQDDYTYQQAMPRSTGSRLSDMLTRGRNRPTIDNHSSNRLGSVRQDNSRLSLRQSLGAGRAGATNMMRQQPRSGFRPMGGSRLSGSLGSFGRR